MLPSFVIGLREGLEAALIVSIIAAFLRKQGRRDLLRWVLIGIGAAVLLCLGAGIALDAYSRNLPQRQQEGLETVIGVLAVGMVTYMVVWMRRHSRQLKGQLEGLAADAMAGASRAGSAMVLMAFLAVIREGLETVVFLLAAFNETNNSGSAGLGALLGILVAVGLGYGIYRGGVRLNLSKFFRATGFVLVLVAAGLVVNALHTAHEAGWLNLGQQTTVDLSWLVQGGTVQSSLLTGMLGIQPRPVVVELLGWLVYLVPVGLYVAWPPGRAVPARAVVRCAGGVGVLAAAAAVVLALTAPARPAPRPITSVAGVTAQVVSRGEQSALVRTQAQDVVGGRRGAPTTYRVTSVASVEHAGITTDVYRATVRGTGSAARPARLSPAEVSELNGGRLPIGLRPDSSGQIAMAYRDVRTLTIWLDARTDRVIDLGWHERVTALAGPAGRRLELSKPVADQVSTLAPAAAAAAATRDDRAHLDRRALLHALAGWAAALAAVSLLVAAGFALGARRRERAEPVAQKPVGTLVRG